MRLENDDDHIQNQNDMQMETKCATGQQTMTGT